MLGLPGFRVLEAREVDGEVELTAVVVGCVGCGVRAVSKDRPTVVVRDVDGFGRPARLRWVKRRWRFPDADFPVTTWTEQTPRSGRGCR